MSASFANPTRRRLLAMGGASLALVATGARAEAPALLTGASATVTMTGEAFGSIWRVTLPAGKAPEALRPGLEIMLARIDRAMSPWRLDSEITAFNLAPAGGFSVSAETALVARAALATARASDGWFDPTVGPLVSRFGFGPIAGPEDEAAHWERLAAGADALDKSEDGLTLDLCGIAKGRALDLMVGQLAAAGHEDFLIDMGGELYGRGLHPAGRPWQVAIEDPRPGIEAPAGGLRLDGLAIATSGLRMQSYDIGGTSYSHIIDPHSGRPVQSAIASVSVLAADGMSADAWATALTAAGEAGPALAQREDVAALFLMRGPDGFSRELTGDFASHLL